jgi:RHS repeat-associated protein
VYRFSSKEIVSHTNSVLYYYGFRFYDPPFQRWLNRDPIGEKGGLNLYGYACNNPLSLVDPLGLEIRSSPNADILGLVPAPTGPSSYYSGDTIAESLYAQTANVGSLIENSFSGLLDMVLTTLGALGEGIQSIATATVGHDGFLALGPAGGVLTEGAGGLKALGSLSKLAKMRCAAKAGAQVEQYALRAADSGFYPMVLRGTKEPQFITFLEKGDVWKFGTTKNPATRYSQSYLDSIGEYGVQYSTEFQGTLQEAVTLQNMKIQNFRLQAGRLPPGNKVVN